MSEKLFSPQLIAWAMERTGMDIAELAGRMKATPEKLEAWRNGKAYPTFAQAEKLAKAAYVPVAFLMLGKVPQMIEGMTDFRTHDSRPLSNQSPALEAAILDARACQDWYRDYLEKNGVDKNDFAGCLRKVDDPDRAAEAIKASLGIDALRKEAKTVEQYLSRLVFKIEKDLGVCVMRAGHVKNNPRRTLKPEEFRGFALADAVAPLIFVNSRDGAAAQVLTVVHELIHIARNESGVSADALLSHEERYANAVAGGVLIPTEMLQHLQGADEVLEAARVTAARLKVSAWAVLTRGLRMGIVSQEAYRRAVGVIKQTRAEASIKGKKKQRGSGFYVQKLDALGRNLSCAMLSAVNARELLYRDLWTLSGIKPAQVSSFMREHGNRLTISTLPACKAGDFPHARPCRPSSRA